MATTFYTQIGKQTTVDLKTMKKRHYDISIGRDGLGLIVRKTELIGYIRIPLFESYVLDIADALKLQQQLTNQIHNFKLN